MRLAFNPTLERKANMQVCSPFGHTTVQMVNISAMSV
jgi:hypothetical protein